MTKHEFLDQLRQRLSGLPEEDRESSLSYYSEIIDDRMEDGLSEEEAVEAVGSVSQIADQILMDTPLPKLMKAKVRTRHKLKGWEIALLILGAPLWLPLLFAAAATVFALYGSFWAVILSLYVVDASLVICGGAGIFSFVFFLCRGQAVQALLLLGCGLVAAGVAILFFFLCNLISKYTLLGSKKVVLAIKSCVIGKEQAA